MTMAVNLQQSYYLLFGRKLLHEVTVSCQSPSYDHQDKTC